VIWGVALSNLLQGLPIDSSQEFTGNFLDLFSPFTVFAGLAFCLLFLFHGAGFLSLRTVGDLGQRSARAARRLAAPALLAGILFMVWCVATAVAENDRGVLGPLVPAVAGSLALCGAALAARARRPGLSFTLGAAGIVGVIATLFTGLYPRVMVSSTDLANSLTTGNAASSHYSLTVITIVAGCLLPVVLAYQSWSYWVFRHRVSEDGFEQAGNPIEAIRQRTEKRR
jgi:cytochrome d ubiquinol oxidase subunit II